MFASFISYFRTKTNGIIKEEIQISRIGIFLN